LGGYWNEANELMRHVEGQATPRLGGYWKKGVNWLRRATA